MSHASATDPRFAEIESHRPHLVRYALSQLRDSELAEEAVQEALLAALEGAPGHEVFVDAEIGRRAKIPIERMLDFAKKYLPTFRGSGDA